MIPGLRHGAVALAGMSLALTVGVGLSASATAASSAGFTASREVSRVNLVAGVDQVVDRRTVSVTVDQTTNLRGGQQVQVSWSGARPTGGVRLDPNSADAVYQEFPVVILQCRGIDSSTAPAAQQVTPETCWTQYPRERFQSSGLPFPEYRVDRYADPADRKQVVGAPDPRPGNCYPAVSERWTSFRAVTGQRYYYGPNGCGGLPPEASSIGGGGAVVLPPNDTFAATRLDGTGSAKFRVQTSDENASLGCSQTVSCVIEVIPIEGVSCDVDAAALPVEDRPAPGAESDATSATCLRDGGYAPGALARSGAGPSDPGVSGALWWTASNWRNRIAVPLNFSPAENVCDGVSASKGSVNIYGSELLIQATAQWAPAFCLDPAKYPFTHVQVGEPQAANGIGNGSGITAAFVSDPPDGGWTRPVVTAPTAVTGFAIGYSMDDGDKREYKQLRLTPRLLAKLLTESYPAISAVKSGYQALSGNPVDLAQDPEFLALNPGMASRQDPGIAAATMLTVSAGTDVMTALTSYIDADPEARAFLDGQPDPWGMVVNPSYKGIALPVDTWPLLDTYQPTDLYRPGINDCLHDNPVPYLPLVAAPLSRMPYVTLAMQYAIANSQVVCYQPIPLSTDGEKLTALGRQTIGYRFVLGVVPLADAVRYRINTAALQTQVSPSAVPKFTDATGRAFAAPTATSLRAAASFLKPDETSRTWPLPYDTWRTDPTAADAYPGTMVVYTAVPTSGLSADDGAHYAAFLDYVAGAGQVQGSAQGQLPDGYLPLTEANGLGGLSRYTSVAAAAVRAQTGTVPALVSATAPPVASPTPSATPTPTAAPAPTPSATGRAPVAGRPVVGPSRSAPATPGPRGTGSPAPAPSPAASTVALVAVRYTSGTDLGTGAQAVPALIAVAVVAGLLAAAVTATHALRRTP